MEQLSSQEIIELCLTHGFALAGITKAQKSNHASSLTKWLADGKHGEMDWMNRNVEVRLDPRQLLDGAKSVIVVVDRYGILDEPPLAVGHGRVARYARGKDYHKVMKQRIHKVCDVLQSQFTEERFRGCVDTAPVLEREFAERSGIGAIGKHTLLIEQGIGSWLFIGVIVTTVDIESSTKQQHDPCATCTACIDACPTDAITPWSVDGSKCISYLTIEHRSEIAPEFFSGIGEWLFGCDICQEVCPHNQLTSRGTKAELHSDYDQVVPSLDVLEVLRWDENARRVNFLGGSAMKRAKLGMMRRNAVIVAGNMLMRNPNEALLDALKDIAEDDEDVMVRNTAVAVLKNL